MAGLQLIRVVLNLLNLWFPITEPSQIAFFIHCDQELELGVISQLEKELKRFKRILHADFPACSEREVEDEEDQNSNREEMLKITLNTLRNMDHTHLANTLQTSKSSVEHRFPAQTLETHCPVQFSALSLFSSER